MEYLGVFWFFNNYLGIIKDNNSEAYHKSFKTSGNTLRTYAGDSLPFSKVTVKYLEAYEKSLRTNRKIAAVNGEEVGLSDNTIHLRMRHLKEVIDKAIKMEHIKYKQINGYRWPVYEEPVTEYLTLEETDNIWQQVYKGYFDNDISVKLVAAFFLVECYGGIRFSDWGKYSIENNILGDNFKCRAKKNGEPIYLPLKHFKRLRMVLDYIIDQNLIFTGTEQNTNRNLKYIARKAGLNKPITTHTGRRTFATILSIMKWTDIEIAEAMGISPKTVRTYVKVLRDKVLDAAEQKGGI